MKTREDEGKTELGLMLGKFRDETGDRLTPTHTKKKGGRIRYYVSNGLVSGKPRPEACLLRFEAYQFSEQISLLGAENSLFQGLGKSQIVY